MHGYPHLMARHALHAGLVLVNDLDGICPYDRGLDSVRGVRAAEPENLE